MLPICGAEVMIVVVHPWVLAHFHETNLYRGDAWGHLARPARARQAPIAVVSAGAKAILELPRTLEVLETLGVLVVGYRTSEFLAF